MAEGDVKARLPLMPVENGQKHGYIGDVDTYPLEQVQPGYTNAPSAEAVEQVPVTPAPRTSRTVSERKG